MTDSLLPFIGIAFVVIVAPGPDTALTIRNSVAAGRLGGIATAFGIVTGQLVWELATSAGLVAVLLASERVFHVIKLAGALYLIVLGARSLFAALRSRAAGGAAAGGGDVRRGRNAYAQGLLSNLGNPKMAVFFAGIFPQFAPGGQPTFGGLMTLGLIFSSMTVVWLSLYVLLIERMAAWFRKPRVQRGIKAASGTALIGLGTRLALERD